MSEQPGGASAQSEPSCAEHSTEPHDLAWSYDLEPSQIDGKFWCWGGSHYAVVDRTLLPAALWVLTALTEMSGMTT